MHNNYKLFARLDHFRVFFLEQYFEFECSFLDILKKLIGMGEMLIHQLHQGDMSIHMNLVFCLTSFLDFLDDIGLPGYILQDPQLLVLDFVEEAEVQVHSCPDLQDIASDVTIAQQHLGEFGLDQDLGLAGVAHEHLLRGDQGSLQRGGHHVLYVQFLELFPEGLALTVALLGDPAVDELGAELRVPVLFVCESRPIQTDGVFHCRVVFGLGVANKNESGLAFL